MIRIVFLHIDLIKKFVRHQINDISSYLLKYKKMRRLFI
jgi:hypothetical protein